MLQEILALRPEAFTTCPSYLAAGGAIGLALWLAGGRFARSILTLCAVAAGAWVGTRLPRWRGWGVDGAGTGVGGAILLGAGVYFLDRAVVGAILGVVLAAWAGTAAFLATGGGTTEWAWPAVAWAGGFVPAATTLYKSLPAESARATLFACGAGLAIGLAIAALWPKSSRVLAFSLLGVSLIVLMGLPAVAHYRPRTLGLLPTSDAGQGILLAGLVALGVTVQWWLIPQPKAEASPGAADADETSRPPRTAQPARKVGA